MKNYISINGQKVGLTQEQVEQIRESFGVPMSKLAEAAPGDLVNIGSHEMIVLDHTDGATLLLRKDVLANMRFGDNNNYDGSDADEACNGFAEEIAEIVGEGNILLHEVDLTADDGLKDYGKVQRKASLRTAQMQRQYVDILDKYRPDVWEWLATAYSTPTHENDTWVKCVAPSGRVYCGNCSSGDYAVRPFCILNSNIFVSK